MPKTHYAITPAKETGRICYGLLPSEMADQSIKTVTPIIIKEGESGYHPTDWRWPKSHAEECRDMKNKGMGISPEEAEKMMLASMFHHKPKQAVLELPPEKVVGIYIERRVVGYFEHFFLFLLTIPNC